MGSLLFCKYILVACSLANIDAIGFRDILIVVNSMRTCGAMSLTKKCESQKG